MARGKKKSPKTRYNIQFFLNKDQRHKVDVVRTILERRGKLPLETSTSVFLKLTALDIIRKFRKTVSVEQLEIAEQAVERQVRVYLSMNSFFAFLLFLARLRKKFCFLHRPSPLLTDELFTCSNTISFLRLFQFLFLTFRQIQAIKLFRVRQNYMEF